MWIQIEEGAGIENPRKYNACEVDQLRSLLIEGGFAEKDPIREHFYDVEHNGDTYYVHISPISGNVVLLAKWIRQHQDCCMAAGETAA